MSLTRFNSIRVLAFITWYLALWKISSFPLRLPVLASCFVFEFVQEQIFHPCWSPGIFVWLSLCWDASLLSLEEEVILEYQPALLGPSSLQGFIPQCSIKQIPEEDKVCSLEVQENDRGISKGNCSALSHSKLNGWMSMMRRSSPEAVLVPRKGGIRHSWDTERKPLGLFQANLEGWINPPSASYFQGCSRLACCHQR